MYVVSHFKRLSVNSVGFSWYRSLIFLEFQTIECKLSAKYVIIQFDNIVALKEFIEIKSFSQGQSYYDRLFLV